MVFCCSLILWFRLQSVHSNHKKWILSHIHIGVQSYRYFHFFLHRNVCSETINVTECSYDNFLFFFFLMFTKRVCDLDSYNEVRFGLPDVSSKSSNTISLSEDGRRRDTGSW